MRFEDAPDVSGDAGLTAGLAPWNPATRDLFTPRSRRGPGPPPEPGLAPDLCSHLFLRAATEHYSFRGLADCMGLNPGTLSRVLRRDAPPPSACIASLTQMLTSHATPQPFAGLGVTFADLAPAPPAHRSTSSDIPLAMAGSHAPVEAVAGIDRLVLTGEAAVEAMHQHLAALAVSMPTPSATEAGRLNARLRWGRRDAARAGEPWDRVRRDILKELPSFDDALVVEGRVVPIKIRVSPIELQPWEKRARKFHRIVAVEDGNGVVLAVCGYAAYGRRQIDKGDIWIDVTGTGCTRGLLTDLVARFFTPFVRPGRVTVDEIHLVCDLNRPMKNVVAVPDRAKSTLVFTHGTYYGGLSAACRLVVYDKRAAACADDGDRNVSEFPAYARGWQHVTRLEWRFVLTKQARSQRRPGNVVAMLVERCAGFAIADLGVLAPNVFDGVLLRSAVEWGVPLQTAPTVEWARRRAEARRERDPARTVGKPHARQRDLRDTSFRGLDEWLVLNLSRVMTDEAEVGHHARMLTERCHRLLSAAVRARPYSPVDVLRAAAAKLDSEISEGLTRSTAVPSGHDEQQPIVVACSSAQLAGEERRPLTLSHSTIGDAGPRDPCRSLGPLGRVGWPPAGHARVVIDAAEAKLSSSGVDDRPPPGTASLIAIAVPTAEPCRGTTARPGASSKGPERCLAIMQSS